MYLTQFSKESANIFKIPEGHVVANVSFSATGKPGFKTFLQNSQFLQSAVSTPGGSGKAEESG